MKKKKSARSTGFYLAMGIAVAAIAVVAALLLQKNPYQDLPNYGTNECGDLNDAANVQHLSHHPQQYGDCLKNVNPAKFFEAVGMERNDFLRQNGIE